MSSVTSPLNNGRLYEGPSSSTEYNKLPHINNMAEAAAKNPKANVILLGIIAAHGLADKFSVLLIYKHFDIPDGRVMVYETVQGKYHQDFILCSPRVPQGPSNMRGLHFKAGPDATMIAYEFTTDPGMDLSAHEGFVAESPSAVLKLGVQKIFALTALSICPVNKTFTEFELGQVRSTCLVSDSSWLPTQDVEVATITDWLAIEDYAKYADESVPGIIQLKCTKTRSSRHFNVTCSATRSGSHLGHASDPFSGQSPQDNILDINGQILRAGTEGHAIISYALHLINVS